jgi:nucleoside-diphosphate-sugar epimerase
MNNVAWALRRLPVFGVFGDGRYKIRPIYVDDLAALAVAQSRSTENSIIDAVGPESFTFRQLVATIGALIGKRRLIVPVPPSLGYVSVKMIGWLMHDIFLTREEMAGLMDNLLCVDSPPAGATKLTDWVRDNAATLGRRCASELARRKR